MLSSTPKTCSGSSRSASNSAEYGIAEDSIATAAPISRISGSSSASPAAGIPIGTRSTAAMHMASASPPPPGNTRPVRALSRM
jgi:hypothetical protein